MSRRKPTVVSPTSVLRRSARLASLQNRDGQEKDLAFRSEPPRKIRRELGTQLPSKRLVCEDGSPEMNSSIDGFSSRRRSLRVSIRGLSDSSKEKSSPSSSMKPASTNVPCSCTLRRSPRFSSGGGSVDASSQGRKPSNIVLNKCSTKSLKGNGGGDGVKSRDRSRTKQMYRECDEEEVSEGKNMRFAKENEQKAVPKPEQGKIIGQKEEGLKTKNKLAQGWTEELELALQGAYLTVKPSPNFWKKVSKMVPGKSAQECFDRVNSDLITPRQPQPRSRASRSNLSPIPQFSLSASKLLKPNSPKTKIRHRSNKLSKKTIRHLLEKQNHMDQGLGFDLFSVFEPGTTSNLLSTPVEKGQRLPRILETPLPCSRFASKDKTTLVSPPVLKQVKNKALHERYIDHLHIREAKRKAESTRLARKENLRPVNDNQKKDSVRAVKDTLLWNVQDAIQKLKGLEAENSSSSSDSCYARGETDEEDESI